MKKIEIKEFRERGYLQEINRRFLHPLGLALEVEIKENGDEVISGINDYRDDEEGVYYAINKDAYSTPERRRRFFDNKEFIDAELKKRCSIRQSKLGFDIEPIFIPNEIETINEINETLEEDNFTISDIGLMQLNKEDIDFNTIAIKDSYFKYIVFKILEWHKEKIGKEDLSSFSRIKIMKLLFFVSSVTSKNYPNGLLDIFDNFYAMSYGPVESDIFNSITIGNYDEWFHISNKIITKGEFFNEIINEISDEYKNIIDISISLLKDINDDIITYTPFELIELSYKWDSWRDTITIVKELDRISEKMKIKQIIKDSKIKDNYLYSVYDY